MYIFNRESNDEGYCRRSSGENSSAALDNHSTLSGIFYTTILFLNLPTLGFKSWLFENIFYYLKFSQPNHMLRVLKRTVSLSGFF